MRLSTLLGILMFGLFAANAHADDLTCPSSPSAQDIDAWRLTVATALNDGTIGDAVVAAKIKECFGAQIPQCVKRVYDYSTRKDIASASQDVSIADSPQKQPPAEILLSNATGLVYQIPENIEQIAAERGWPAVRYKSRHSGGFDPGTPSLLMVYVPGDKVSPPVNYDRWLNFALPADFGVDALTPKPQAPVPTPADYAAEAAGGPNLPRTFTMVTLDRKTPTSPGKVYFQKFHRSGAGERGFTPESTSSVTGCVSCHPNGLRAISPLGYHVREGEAQLPETDWKTVELINDAMIQAAGAKTVSWRDVVVDTTGATKPLLSPKSQGPNIGPVKPLNSNFTRTKEFILGGTLPDGIVASGCYNRRPSIDVTDIFNRAPGASNIYNLSANPQIDADKVASYMKCGACHGDNSRAALNSYTAWAQIDFKILVDQSMPLGAHTNPLDSDSGIVEDDLNADERIALTNCLQAEYELERQKVKEWLTQTVCQ